MVRRKNVNWLNLTPYPRIFMTDLVRTPDPVEIIKKLNSDTAVIFRHYQSENKEKIAHQLMQVARTKKITLLVSGDYQLTRKIDADGLHIPEYLLYGEKSVDVFRNIKPQWMVTAAVHSMRALKRAEKLGVDAVLVSPVFKTKSHDTANPIGVLGLAKFVQQTRLPVFALGGVTEKNKKRVYKTGAAGFAGIGHFSDIK